MENIYLSVKVEGEEVGDMLEMAEVEESDSEADLAVLTFIDRNMVLSDVLHEGLSVEIDLGRSDAHALVFKGIITGIRGYFPSRGTPMVEVEAVDSLISLSLTPRTKGWWNTTVSQIVRDIAMSNNLVPGDIDISEDAMIDEARPRQQVAETDLAFLNRLAQDYDCKVYVEHGSGPDSLNFVSTQSPMEAAPVEETLTFNLNLEEFTVRFDAFATASEERLVTTDPLSGDRIEVSEEFVGFTEPIWTPDPERIARMGEGAARIATLIARSASKKATLTDFWRTPARHAGAAARQSSDRSRVLGDRARRMGQMGRGRAAGSMWLRPRRRVEINGYPGRWSGDWYIARVRHQVNVTGRDYKSHFVCTR